MCLFLRREKRRSSFSYSSSLVFQRREYIFLANELPLQEYTYIDSSTFPFISRLPERVIGGLMDGEAVYVDIVSIELELAQEL
jgi:hypothetical protein